MIQHTCPTCAGSGLCHCERCQGDGMIYECDHGNDPETCEACAMEQEWDRDRERMREPDR